MAGGLVALLDDIATIARTTAATTDDITAAAGKTSAKAAGVVVGGAAVTPKFVEGASPKHELPIVWRITKGSLTNKIVIILPITLLLSQFLPQALTPILMLGGSYLCFEGVERVWEKIKHRVSPERTEQERIETATNRAPQSEDSLVKSATFINLILSAEIVVISLNEVADQPLLSRALIPIVVTLIIMLATYGVVGFLIKVNDISLHLQSKRSAGTSKPGTALIKTIPIVLNTISIISTFTMLWVGGRIMVAGLDELGWHLLYQLVHSLEQLFTGGFLDWLASTTDSLIFDAIWRVIIVAIIAVLPFDRSKHNKSDAQKYVTSPST